MSRALKISPTALETLAAHTGKAIELDPDTHRGYLDVDGTTYWAEIHSW